MLDIPHIESLGGSDEKLKAKFMAPAEERPEKLQKFIELNAGRIGEGVSRCLSYSKFWWAIDQAYDASRQSLYYAMAEALMNNQTPKEQITQIVRSCNAENMLNGLLVPKCNSDGTACCDSGGKPVYNLNCPVFFEVMMPLALGYTTARTAKLFTDIDVFPFYRYSPVVLTDDERLRSEILTNRVQRMVSQFGYKRMEGQAIHATNVYGHCLTFPMEPWYTEKQQFDGKLKTIKAGVRFAQPHPSRVFYDLNHPLYTLNTDTGCEYAGYFDMVRAKDLMNDSRYWTSPDKPLSFGGGLWPDSFSWDLYFKFYPCRDRIPSSFLSSGGTDRLTEAFLYTGDNLDQGVPLTVMFVKCIPKDWDLFDYEQPVWMRLVYAGDNTVVHAKAFAYSPTTVNLYDWDTNRSCNPSLMLQLLPHQYMLNNLITQYIITVRQNLSRVTFYNGQQIDKKYMDIVQNLGERRYRTHTFIEFSAEKLKYANTPNPGQLFQTADLGHSNTQEIAAAINIYVGLMERMVGFSAQEIGAAASHEQSAREVVTIASNTGVKLRYTGSFRDDAIHARKRLFHDAIVSYDDDEVFAEVAELSDATREAVERIGFKIESEPGDHTTRAGVRGPRTKLVLEAISTEREGEQRLVEEKVAVAMLQAFQTIVVNPLFMQAVGMQQIADRFNDILEFAGLPPKWRFRVINEQANPEQQAAEFAKQMQQIAMAVTGKEMEGLGAEISEKLVQPLAAQIGQIGQGLGETQKALVALAQAGHAVDSKQEQEIAAVNQKADVFGQALSRIVQMTKAAVAATRFGGPPGSPGPFPPQP